MFIATLDKVRCPHTACRSALHVVESETASASLNDDIQYATLSCATGAHQFPILHGVAVLVPDSPAYLRRHAECVLRYVDVSRLDATLLRSLEEARAPQTMWSIDSEFALSLYLANHYLYEGREGQIERYTRSEIISKSIRAYWNDNPVSRLKTFFVQHKVTGTTLLDLGCNVGGAIARLGNFVGQSLGIDFSFASVFWARRMMLHSPLRVRLPADRLQGPVSEEVEMRWDGPEAGRADFVVGDIGAPPVGAAEWDIVLALGVLDIVRDPIAFSRTHIALAAPGGYVVQSSPYLWSEEGAAKLRSMIPLEVRSSSLAAEWLYQNEALDIIERQDDVPWPFFKFDRRIELNAAHLFIGRKTAARV